jgi:hypothetical protein
MLGITSCSKRRSFSSFALERKKNTPGAHFSLDIHIAADRPGPQARALLGLYDGPPFIATGTRD